MTTERLRALLGDRYDDVIERALTAADTPHNGYQVMRGYVDERDVAAVLAAALPDLMAAAWDEGYAAGDHDYGAQIEAPDWPPTPNPYRTTATAAHCDRGPCHLPAGHGGHGGPCNPGDDANTDERNER